MMTGRDELGNVRELLSCCLLSKYVGMFLQKLRYLQGIHGQSLHLISRALFAQQVNEGCFVVVFADGFANNSRSPRKSSKSSTIWKARPMRAP